MRFPLVLLSALAASLTMSPASAQMPEQPLERYRVTQVGGGLGVEINETVVFYAIVLKDHPTRWVVEERRRDDSWCGQRDGRGRCEEVSIRVRRWIDGATCPGISTVLAGAPKLGSFAVPPADDPSWSWVSDTPLLSLRSFLPARFGTGAMITISEYKGPLADWWRASEETLRPCWSDEAPLVNGAAMRQTLTADAP